MVLEATFIPLLLFLNDPPIRSLEYGFLPKLLRGFLSRDGFLLSFHFNTSHQDPRSQRIPLWTFPFPHFSQSKSKKAGFPHFSLFFFFYFPQRSVPTGGGAFPPPPLLVMRNLDSTWSIGRSRKSPAPSFRKRPRYGPTTFSSVFSPTPRRVLLRPWSFRFYLLAKISQSMILISQQKA